MMSHDSSAGVFAMAAGAAAVAAAPTILTAKKTDSPVILGSGEHRYEVHPQLAAVAGSVHLADDAQRGVRQGRQPVRDSRRDTRTSRIIRRFSCSMPTASTSARSAANFRAAGTASKCTRRTARSFCTSPGTSTSRSSPSSRSTAKQFGSGMRRWNRASTRRAKTPSRPARGAATGSCPRTSRSIRRTATSTWPTATARTSIHLYDRDANYKSTFGKAGKEDGQFDLPHGVWIDGRPGREPSVVVADRVNDRLQWFTLDGKHQQTLDGFLLPANVDTFGDVMLVPELQSRVTLLDRQEQSHRPSWRRCRLARARA